MIPKLNKDSVFLGMSLVLFAVSQLVTTSRQIKACYLLTKVCACRLSSRRTAILTSSSLTSFGCNYIVAR